VSRSLGDCSSFTQYYLDLEKTNIESKFLMCQTASCKGKVVSKPPGTGRCWNSFICSSAKQPKLQDPDTGLWPTIRVDIRRAEANTCMALWCIAVV